MNIIGSSVSSVSEIGGNLASGLKNTVFIQVQNSIENAVTVSRAVYQSLGLVNRPTTLDVRHEFCSLTATITQVTVALSAFPADSAQGDHILGIAPKGVALCAALARTTAALKCLPGPVSEEDGLALLNSYEEVQTKTAILFPAINARAGSFEHGSPGLVNHGLSRLKELFQDLAGALSAVLPPQLKQDKAQGLHTSIQNSIESSFTHSRDLGLASV